MGISSNNFHNFLHDAANDEDNFMNTNVHRCECTEGKSLS